VIVSVYPKSLATRSSVPQSCKSRSAELSDGTSAVKVSFSGLTTIFYIAARTH
jgi:hypothetical protein